MLRSWDQRWYTAQRSCQLSARAGPDSFKAILLNKNCDLQQPECPAYFIQHERNLRSVIWGIKRIVFNGEGGEESQFTPAVQREEKRQRLRCIERHEAALIRCGVGNYAKIGFMADHMSRAMHQRLVLKNCGRGGISTSREKIAQCSEVHFCFCLSFIHVSC